MNVAGVGPVCGVPKPPFPCFSVNWLLILFPYSSNLVFSYDLWFEWIGKGELSIFSSCYF